MTARWLDILVRARQADEDVAARKLASAQRTVVDAMERARREAERASSLLRPTAPMTVSAFLATAAIAQATAASASTARQRVAICEQDVIRERAAVIAASRSRKVSENLRERRRLAEVAARLKAEQAEQDDLTSTRSANADRRIAQGATR